MYDQSAPSAAHGIHAFLQALMLGDSPRHDSHVLPPRSVMATVLITDIRDYTAMAELEPPAVVLRWLNAYYATLVPIIELFGGTVMKFEGDSLLACFVADTTAGPLATSTHNACKAGIEILAAVKQLNAQRLLCGEPPFVTGIGISTGEVAIGALGWANRSQHTVIGDAVNTAARLQACAKTFGCSTAVICQDTLSALYDRRHDFALRSIGSPRLKGKSKKVAVYQLRDRQAEASPEQGIAPFYL